MCQLQFTARVRQTHVNIMKTSVLSMALLIALAASAEDKSFRTYPKPSYDYGNAMPFSFSYAVKDNKYNDYSHETRSDGKVRVGTYRTLLPDNRVQIVTYKADDYGYVADVKYEGYAKYPASPEYKITKPSYAPTGYPKKPTAYPA